MSVSEMMIRSAAAIPTCASNDEPRSSGAPADACAPSRLHAVVRAHYGFLWRSLRRLGVAAHDLDDAAQRSLDVLARRLGHIAEGAERAFLFQTALRVASELRRARRRDRLSLDPERVEVATDPAPLADEAIARAQARAFLDDILDAMPLDVRAVFVLFELEQLTTAEIAELLAIPPGTVSSRLRRGREEFEALARRMRARRGAGERR